MRLTKQEILDYILSGDFDKAIAKMDCKAVARALEYDGRRANHIDIVDAMLQAKSRVVA